PGSSPGCSGPVASACGPNVAYAASHAASSCPGAAQPSLRPSSPSVSTRCRSSHRSTGDPDPPGRVKSPQVSSSVGTSPISHEGPSSIEVPSDVQAGEPPTSDPSTSAFGPSPPTSGPWTSTSDPSTPTPGPWTSTSDPSASTPGFSSLGEP